MKDIYLFLLSAFYLLAFSLSFRLMPDNNLSNRFKRSNFIRPILDIRSRSVYLNCKLPTENENKLLDERIQYFVPGFIATWALGYSLIGYIETSGGGLGDLGGYIGASLCLFLLLALVGVTAYEVFKA